VRHGLADGACAVLPAWPLKGCGWVRAVNAVMDQLSSELSKLAAVLLPGNLSRVGLRNLDCGRLHGHYSVTRISTE
jgi:hypothetical protein